MYKVCFLDLLFIFFSDTVMQKLCEEILGTEFSEPISFFLIPALSSELTYKNSFPYTQLVSYLSREHKFLTTSWMLYSFLSLEPENLSEY